eukprot:gene4961-6178_t
MIPRTNVVLPSKIENFIILDCVGFEGAAISAYNSELELKNVKISGNFAEYGAATFLKQSSLKCSNCEISGNTAARYGSGVYLYESKSNYIESNISCNIPVSGAVDDLYLYKSDAIFRKSNVDDIGVDCNSDSDAYSTITGEMSNYRNFKRLCSSVSKCKKAPVKDYYQLINNELTKSVCNKDGVCSGRETCLNCPSDCEKCHFSGAVLWLYDSNLCPIVNGTTVSNETCLIKNYPMPLSSFGISSEYHGNITSYFKSEKDDTVEIKVSGSHLGVNIYLNNINIIRSHFVQPEFQQTHSVKVKSKITNSLVVSIFTPASISRSSISVSILSSSGNEINTFFSQNICGDGIVDLNEPSCNLEIENAVYGVKIANTRCGDGICNEVPELCLQDCYDVVGKSCSAQSISSGSSVPYTDTVSHLINNQLDFSLPGLNFFSHGIDLKTGAELPTVIFDIGYCDNISYTVIQDIYRESSYNIPPEFHAEILPICSYESEVSIFESSQAYQSKVVEENSMSVSFDLSVNLGRWGGTANMAYSESNSVDTFKRMEGSTSGETISVNIQCISSTVTRNSVRFHQNFVKDLSQVRDANQMLIFIERYGALYYQSASMGGNLEVFIRVDSNANLNQNSQTIKESSDIAAGGSFSTPYGGASAKYSGSEDSEITNDSQTEFEKKTSKSQVLVKGGHAGSFGPDYSSPSSFSEWAKTIDLRPVPIKSKVDFVGNIIPPSWTLNVDNQMCILYRNETCILEIGSELGEPLNSTCHCHVKDTQTCSSFIDQDSKSNVTCIDFVNNVKQVSAQELWSDGYRLYVEKYKKDDDSFNYYFLKINFIYQLDPPSTPLDLMILSNLTMIFHGTDGKNYSSLVGFKLIKDGETIGCNSRNLGCQTVIDNPDIFPSNFELESVYLTYFDSATNTSIPVDVKKYFSDIIIHSSTPSYSRGYLLNLEYVPHYRITKNDTVSVKVDTFPIDPEWNGETYTEDKKNIRIEGLNEHFDQVIKLVTFNITHRFETITTYSVTNNTYYLPPNPINVMYPDPGKTRLYFSLPNFQTQQFFAIMAGSLGVNTEPIQPINGKLIAHYRPVFDRFVGNIQQFQFSFPNSEPFSTTYDDLFILWVCPSPTSVCASDIVSPEYKKLGFINLVRGTTFEKFGRYINYKTIYPRPTKISN